MITVAAFHPLCSAMHRCGLMLATLGIFCLQTNGHSRSAFVYLEQKFIEDCAFESHRGRVWIPDIILS